MAEPQKLVSNLSENMQEYIANEDEVHLEPQTETTPVAKLEARGEEQNLAQKRRKHKELSKVELSKLKNQKMIKHSFKIKPTLSG